MASLSTEVASMSVGDNLTAWEVVDYEYFFHTSLSVRPKIATNSKPIIRTLVKGDVFLSLGKKTRDALNTRNKLEDGGWVSSKIGVDGGSDDVRVSKTLCVQISAEEYAKKKEQQDKRESDKSKERKRTKKEANDALAAKLAAKFELVKQLIAENSANTSTFDYISENGNIPALNEVRTTGRGTKSTIKFMADGKWNTTESHSWSKEYMNGACWAGGYKLDVFGKYFCSDDGTVAGYVTKVVFNPEGGGATSGDDPTVPDVHDLIKGTYVNETLTFSFE
jgi:hypothetical protein